MNKLFTIVLSALFAISCQQTTETPMNMNDKVNEFASFELKADISDLSSNQTEMLELMFEAANIMDELFWLQASGSKDKILELGTTPDEKRFIEINYGPWERLNGNKPFISGIEEKPQGARFYPQDMSEEEFNALNDSTKTSLYTIIKRGDNNELVTQPYSEAYSAQLQKASELLLKASELAEDDGLKKYLALRSEALLSNDYLASDLAWMDMKTNRIDFVVGPIENYEDKLYGYKAAFEAYILLKDMVWSKKLERFSSLLPELQKKLPVANDYKSETPGSDSDLGAYDVVYYAGDCNAGSKTIAINLPNDPRVHAAKGSRRLQLKNAMQAKFDKILLPISKLLIEPALNEHITFDAFFENTMYHEVAHGIGVHYTIDENIPARKALKDNASWLEEGKADILGVFLVDELIKMGELNGNIKDNYVTFTAGIFRSIRFGAASSHGKANLVRYNYFKNKGAFSRNSEGIYTIDFEKMKSAINSLSEEILVIQGNGDYDAAQLMYKRYGEMDEELKADLAKIAAQKIPVDIVFEQGAEVLGL